MPGFDLIFFGPNHEGYKRLYSSLDVVMYDTLCSHKLHPSVKKDFLDFGRHSCAEKGTHHNRR